MKTAIAPLFKRLLFVFGIALAVLAFVATGAELAAHAVNGALGLAPGAQDVWRTLAPDSLDAAHAFHPDAPWWPLFALPGWLLFGAPGLALIIAFHSRDDTPNAEHEASLFLFDELAKRAHEDGYADDEPNLNASHDFHPAAPHYARDDVADDLIDGGLIKNDGHDYLFTAKDPPDKTPGKTPDDPA